MNFKTLLIPVLFFVFIFSSCKHELKDDAAKVGDAMCRNIEIMNKLRAANPADSAAIQTLRHQQHQLEIEMTIIYKEFGEKYKEKTKDPEFNKKFNLELRRAMLDCPSLSPKDRELFEKELNK